MAKNAPATYRFRCKNRYGDRDLGIGPCKDYGSKGTPGNIVEIPENEIPPAGKPPKCPGEGCGMELVPVDGMAASNGARARTASRGSSGGIFKFAVAAVVVLAVAGVLWLVFSGGGSPKIAVSPTLLEWGEVAPGEMVERVLTISNEGKEPLQIISGDLTGMGFGVKATVDGVAPGGTADVILTFRSDTAGMHDGQLLLTTNDPETKTTTITLTATVKLDAEQAVRKTFMVVD